MNRTNASGYIISNIARSQQRLAWFKKYQPQVIKLVLPDVRCTKTSSSDSADSHSDHVPGLQFTKWRTQLTTVKPETVPSHRNALFMSQSPPRPPARPGINVITSLSRFPCSLTKGALSHLFLQMFLNWNWRGRRRQSFSFTGGLNYFSFITWMH